ncbi:MAG TPA: hypothetical protein P5079_08415 [Elusimicrobiota bacterium]|nr:hypothetical protein [Elusimicrobiota bacterium]
MNIGFKNPFRDRRLLFVGHKAAIDDFVAVWRMAAIVEAAFCPLRKFIPNPLRSQLPFKLRECKHDVTEQPTGRGRSVETLSHRYIADVMGLQNFDQLVKIAR